MRNRSPFRGIDNPLELQPGDPVADVLIAPPPFSDAPKSRPPADTNQPIETEAPFAAVSEAEARTLALSPAQQTAIGLLTSGHTLVDAATAAGVSRMTLYRWLKGDAAFSAAFNAWQKDVLDTARGRILALSDLAVTTVAKAMTGGDARTALKILQSVGVLDRAQPGSTDPDEIQRVQKLERKKAQTELRKAEDRAELEELLP